MREERGTISGDVVVYELFTLWGKVAGNITVVDGGKLYMRGSVYGDINVAPGGRAHIFGNVQGNVEVQTGGKLVHSGVIGGDLTNLGGRIHVDLQSKVMGKIKTKEGETNFETPMRLPKD
ncbi:MAG: polymer-forming cytoskeletal protein [Tepidisphaeraceae bacterium]|jgi:cytoskeletal protein CcmA (bactofilin family)